MTNYNVLVIGGGPAGYVAAIRCAQLGMSVACVDSWLNNDGVAALGGTCLNVGCIPSKALLDSSHYFHHASTGLSQHGITTDYVSMDIKQMQQRKDDIVRTLNRGISSLLLKNKVTWLKGHAKLHAPHQVEITQMGEHAGERITVEADNIIIATGSVPANLPSAVINDRNIVDSSGALEFNEVPRRLTIIGAGVIGLELGSIWNRLGSDVLLLEAQPSFLPAVDKDISTQAARIFTKQGLTMEFNALVSQATDTNNEVRIHYEQNGEQKEICTDKLIVAIGRIPNTSGLGATRIGLELDERGFIRRDDNWQTNLEGVYAIGDVAGGAMLAHKASEEGIRLAEALADHTLMPLNPLTIPWIIYTWPEIAWTGMTEEAARADGREIKTGRYTMAASGRARAMGETDGLVKVISDAGNDRLLGVHIFAANASEWLTEAVTAMEFDGTTEDIAGIVHAHPTLSEGLHEAALAALGRPIHS